MATAIASRNYDELFRITIKADTAGFHAVNETIGEFVEDDYPDRNRTDTLHWLPDQLLDDTLFLSHFLTEAGIEVLLFRTHPRFAEIQKAFLARCSYGKP